MKNKNTHTQFRFFADLDRELMFLRSMNRQGWRLESVARGMLYRFSRSKPGEYTTMIHTAPSNQHEALSKLAGENGFETVPHTRDGFGDRLYFSGKRENAFRGFIDEDDSRRQTLLSIAHRMRSLAIVYNALLLLFIALTAALYVRPLIAAVSGGIASDVDLLAPFLIILGVLAAVFIGIDAALIRSYIRTVKKLR